MQPETSPDQLGEDQSMKEPKIIVANQTCRLSDRLYANSGEGVTASESSDRIGVRASNSVIALN